jgi:hypothetical protein
MLALGLFVTLIQIIRIFTISKLVSYTNSYSIVVWSIVEINLGVCRSHGLGLLKKNMLIISSYQGCCLLHPFLCSTVSIRSGQDVQLEESNIGSPKLRHENEHLA